MSPSLDATVKRVRDSTARITTVWGLPGVGKTWVLERALSKENVSWVHAEGLDAEALLAASGERTVWDGASLEAARAAASQWDGELWISCCARTRLVGEAAVEIAPLDLARSEGLLLKSFQLRGFTVVPEGLARACLGLPILIERACDLFELTGRIPTAGAWLDAPAGPDAADLEGALEASLAGLDQGGLAALRAFAAFDQTFDLGAAMGLGQAFSLEAVRANRDHNTLQLVKPGRFTVPPLIRAHVRRRWPAELEVLEGVLFEVLGARASAAWAELERTGKPPRMANEVADLLRTAASRRDGWEQALAVATLEEPRTVPRPLLDTAVVASDSPLNLRTRGRHLRAVGDNERALQDLNRAAAHDDAEAWRELGALLHRVRRGDEAREAYSRSLACEIGARGAAVTRANLAALDHDEMRMDSAREGYTEAIATLKLLGDDRLAGLFASNLGALELEQGRHAHAEESLRRAVRQLERAADRRLLAIALGNLAWVEVESRRLESATKLLGRALRGSPDFRTEITLRIRLGAVHALAGDLGRSRAVFDGTTGLLLAADDRIAVALMHLYRGFLDVGTGDRAGAAARLAAARARGEGRALVEVSDDARVGARWLERMLLEAPGKRLVVGPAGEWALLPDGSRVDFSKYGAVQRILLHLALNRIAAPGARSPLEALFLVGWPGESIQISSARNRVHVALNKLRSAGLKGCLLRDAAGYLLDPALPVFVTDDGLSQ